MKERENGVAMQQPAERPGGAGTVNILEYVQIVAERKFLILCTTFVVALGSALFSMTLPNLYTASALVVVSDDDSGGVGAMLAQFGGLASLAGGSMGGPTKGDLYLTMLSTDTVKDPIIDRFRLMQVYEARLRSDAYAAMNARAEISAGKKDGVITISYSDEDPKRAAAIANAYVEELGKLTTNLSMKGAGSSRGFLEQRLTAAKADLARADEALKGFQSKNKVVAVPEQAKASIEGVAQLQAQLAMQQVQLSSLQRQFADTSPEVKGVKAAIGTLKAQIARQEGGGALGSIPSIGSMPQMGQEYVRLMRELKIQEALVETLTKQYEMVKINSLKDTAPFQLLQMAKVPEKKSKPVRSRIVILSAAAGSFLSVVYVFLCASLTRVGEEDRQRLQRIGEALGLRRRRQA
ncbi:Wzz/FepE/Etk N-terminal domain-containing protein [Geomonas sp. RF6]|uniref:GumC family protein n=1 Tax=Geomonas sp. RF6 TaxID=2897342 RepID=UPI001E4BC924|nr:Wzz/FepE/Etk N-terminal domain-containing protein [Geomonas sp. RF6]UFS69927.1 Wzz/FepE/Etk N-terminal domain-containing protein [Geomonas sp. RF6]